MFRLSHRHTSNPGKLIGETRVPRILCGLRRKVKQSARDIGRSASASSPLDTRNQKVGFSTTAL
jgi:hypothetical protein